MDAEGHGAQREGRRQQAPRALHGAERAPEPGAVVLQDALHLPEQRSQVRSLCRTQDASLWIRRCGVSPG